MSKRSFGLVLAAVVAAPIAGCAGDGEPEYDESVASLSFTGYVLYDAGTQCTVNGGTMHCCPVGWAMIGAHVEDNVFKCAGLTGTAGARFLDVGTVRNGMHACPAGTVMVGLHAGHNWLVCQAPVPAPYFEYVDGNPPTSDGRMHICPSPYAMAGLHDDNNLFTCAR